MLAEGKIHKSVREIHLRHRTIPLIGNEVSDELGPFGCLLHVITRNNNGIYVSKEGASLAASLFNRCWSCGVDPPIKLSGSMHMPTCGIGATDLYPSGKKLVARAL